MKHRDPEGAANVGFASISRHLARIKNAHFPKAPLITQAIADAYLMLSVSQQYGRSLVDSAKSFYNETVIEDNFKYSIFSSGTLLEKLITMPTERNFHIDATFGVVPHGEYKQLLIIHVSYKDHVS